MNILYDDVIVQIALHLNYYQLKILQQTSKRFHNFFDQKCLISIFRQKLVGTKLSLMDYNLKELCHLSYANLQYKNISVGSTHGLILTNHGYVYVLGYLSDFEYCNTSRIIPGLKNIIQ